MTSAASSTSAPPLPEGQVLAAARCAACPKMCRSACPTLAVTANERHQPWGHARTVLQALREPGGFVSAAAVEAAFTCAVCAACTPPCKVEGVETPELSWALRAAVFAAGTTPAAGLRAVAEARAGRVPECGDPPGPPAWAEPAETLAALRRLATPGAPLLLLPGCGVLGRRPAAALAAGRALRVLGVPFSVPDTHRCCGVPALSFGDTASLTAMLGELRAAVRATGAERVAVQSPACAHLLAARAPGLGLALDAVVEPLAAVLAAALREAGPPTGGAAVARLAYHDPCHLARHLGCTEPPRAVLRGLGAEVAELRGRGPTTACSGGGGGLPLTHPALAGGYRDRLAAEVDEAVARGAAGLVTGCGTCAARLSGRVAVPVLELAEAVALRLTEARGEPAPWR
jgi:N,N-dimethylglycine/sarcosine dehydrogenase ferredoxin subunit